VKVGPVIGDWNVSRMREKFIRRSSVVSELSARIMTVTARTMVQLSSNGGTRQHEELGISGGCTGSATANPLYTMQAYFEGKMSLEEFARSEEEKPTVAHDEFDESLPVIDVAALRTGAPEDRQANVARMLEAAKSWGFFKIINHGVPLQVVQTKNPILLPVLSRLYGFVCSLNLLNL